ncbi:hypothetical protein, partial [Solihabitans fulvus]|uniref:hypothetical protein n=1 Tax=Solihabitans fulvus TaxID=1892852 RepID=UPI001CB75C96
GERRREFVSRIATGDWDAVVMTRTAFERIPMSPGAQQAYLDKEVAAFRALLERANASESKLTVKRLESACVRAEERLTRKLESTKDLGFDFEMTGIDYLVVDEAHGYKNLRTPSNIPGAAIEGSNRASDLDMKLDYLRGRHGGRIATFATATPIANSVTEAYVMQRYLRPDLLDAARIPDFDVWAGTFGQSVTAIELSPDGAKFRMKTRFAKFLNVPELLAMWHVSADIKTAEDLRLPTPDLVARPGDGKREPQIVPTPPTPELEEFIASLAQRAEDVRNRVVEPEQDNMLTISGDGRAGALDMRLVEPTRAGTGVLATAHDDLAAMEELGAQRLVELWDRHRDPTTGRLTLDPATRQAALTELWADVYGNQLRKIHAVADTMATIWATRRDDVHTGPGGGQVRGALQLGFSDLGTPNSEKWNAYDELRRLLVARTMPRRSIRFVHEAANDQAKGELFAACRSGEVAVLLGSTEKMGVGTNVQLLAAALHHLDCPWRPADVQQRNGRILRQGNLYPEVEILIYVTEGSFDGYSWQTVTRKAEFIAQVMRGKLDVREIEDIGDAALTYTEVKALATGNPLLLEHAEAQAELTRLERLQRAHDRVQNRLDHAIHDGERALPGLQEQVDTLAEVIGRRRTTRGDAFAMSLDGRRYTVRTEVGDQLKARLDHYLEGLRNASRTIGVIGQLGGLPVSLEIYQLGQHSPEARFTVGESSNTVQMTLTEVRNSKPGPLVTKLENALDRLDRLHHQAVDRVEHTRTEIDRARDELGKPFPHTDALTEAKARFTQIEAALAEQAEPENTGVENSVADAVSLQDMAMHDALAMAGLNPGGGTTLVISSGKGMPQGPRSTSGTGSSADRPPSPGRGSATRVLADPNATAVDDAAVEPYAQADPTSTVRALVLRLSREEGLVFRSPVANDVHARALTHPQPGDPGEAGTWEQVDATTWRAVGTVGPLTFATVDQANSAHWQLMAYAPQLRRDHVDLEFVVDEPLPPQAQWIVQRAVADGRATVRNEGPANDGLAAASSPPAPASSRSAGVAGGTSRSGRVLVLRHSRADGALLLGTDRSDNIAEILRASTNRGLDTGRWKWSSRIANGTTEPGAWYIPRTRDQAANATTIDHLARTAAALRTTGFTVQVDLDQHSLSSDGRWRLEAVHPDLLAPERTSPGEPATAEDTGTTITDTYRARSEQLVRRACSPAEQEPEDGRTDTIEADLDLAYEDAGPDW